MLSEIAEQLYMEKKLGKKVCWYQQFDSGNVLKISDVNGLIGRTALSMDYFMSTVDSDENPDPEAIRLNKIYCDPYMPRNDPALIQILECLGKKAYNPTFSDIRILDVPDGSDWKISDYDGVETVYWSETPIHVSYESGSKEGE